MRLLFGNSPAHYLSTGEGLHASDRVPEAPALADFEGIGPTSLFKIFRQPAHTVLFFSDTARLAGDIYNVLNVYLRARVCVVVI